MDDLQASEVTSVFSLYRADKNPLLNVELMSRFTRKDPCLAKISYYVSEGWPSSDDLPGGYSELTALCE